MYTVASFMKLGRRCVFATGGVVANDVLELVAEVVEEVVVEEVRGRVVDDVGDGVEARVSLLIRRSGRACRSAGGCGAP